VWNAFDGDLRRYCNPCNLCNEYPPLDLGECSGSAFKKTGSSLFEVGEVKQEVKNMELKNSGKGGCRTTDETTAEHPRLRNTRSVIYRQVSGRREPFADWMAGMTIKPA
jgi:phage terminase large subunit GpA-like protein